MSAPSSAAVAKAALALLAFLAAGELATRQWLQTPATEVDDPRFGRIPEPHQRFIEHDEGYSVRRTNAFGFFGHDTLRVRPRLRVLLLGDSFAEGLQMPAERTFAAVAERNLPGLEVLNAAQSGRYPLYYAATLPAFEALLHPDAVVIQVNDGDLDELGSPERYVATMSELTESARLARGASPAGAASVTHERGVLGRLLHEATLLKFATERIQKLQLQERLRWNLKWHAAGPRTEYERLGTLPPGAAERLDSLVTLMRAVNPHLVLVYMPHIAYFDGPAHLGYPLRRAFYHEFAARRGIPLVDPSDEILADFARTGQPCHGFANSEIGTGHMNARGHAIIGRELAQRLAAGAP